MRKNKEDMRIFVENGKVLCMNKDAFDYITQLKNRCEALERDNEKLVTELRIIKPILAVDGIKPAVHSLCGYCRFVVRNRWNNDIIGCNKDCVCSDFYPKED